MQENKRRQKLIDYRLSIDYTQEKMAKEWGISTSFYKKIELGIKNPSLESIQRFKVVFPTADTAGFFLT